MEDKMRAANVDRAEILRDVRIVTAANIDSHPRLANEFVLAHNVLSKLAGREIYLVTWPNGVAAMVDAEPGTTGWDDLLIQTYAACLQNHVGPVGG
jgi:hypothetical protein